MALFYQTVRCWDDVIVSSNLSNIISITKLRNYDSILSSIAAKSLKNALNRASP